MYNTKDIKRNDETETVKKFAFVKEPKVNIRMKPSLESEILQMVEKGDKLMVDGSNIDSPGFVPIIVNGNTAYIKEEFVEVK